jgi:meso-butanediol dehydrogenase/(S,S)-butanediol dehydrogenase/diacetyl reductase
MRRFEGRAALVTGAGHGIGRAIAARLAAEGAAVCVAELDGEAGDRVAGELPGGAFAVRCDVTDRASVDAAVSAAADRFGRLDVLVNNVGIDTGTPFDLIDDEDWARNSEPTLYGTVRCVQAALPHLLASPVGGSVVSIGSVNGLAAFGSPAYSAAKAGLQSLTQNLALRYSARGVGLLGPDSGTGTRTDGPVRPVRPVRFNLVAPGTIRTRSWAGREALVDKLARQYPLGRVGEPEDIAAAVAFLASDDASWITGLTVPVDGGLLAGATGLLLTAWQDWADEHSG